MKQEAPHVNIERSIIKQFRKEIWRPFVKGLQDYEMIKDGDKVSVYPAERIPCFWPNASSS
jgi:tRNA 2-thiocytidine biosynthesis protein TtcA